MRTRASFSCLWGGGAALKLAGRARLAVLVAVSIWPIEERHSSVRLLSFACSRSATSLAAASNAKPGAACAASGRTPALAVSGEEAQFSSFLRAHRAALVADCLDSAKERCNGGRLLFFGARPCRDVPAAAPLGCRVRSRRTHAGFSYLWRLAQHSSLPGARAPRRAGCGLCRPVRGALHQRDAFLLGVQPSCDVPAAASNAKPAAA